MPNFLGQEVLVTLNFDCCRCGGPMNVTVQCSGKGVTVEPHEELPIVCTSVPCPGCGQLIQLFFDPSGAVRSVQPFRCFRPMPEPSVN